MKNIRKICTLMLTVFMMIVIGTTAFADGAATLTGGKIGGFTTPDEARSQKKTIVLKKELTAYNLDETSVYAPNISYTYSVGSGEANISVTDAASDHATGVGTVTVPTKAGITTGVTVTGTAANVIAWTNADTLTASTDGTANTKDLKISFENVVFTGPGIYRYVITESLTTGSGHENNTYFQTGVTETKSTDNTDAGSHIRYLDVYVKPSDTYTNGSTAAEWDIYGYVCMYESEEITPDGDTATTGAVKTNGFVAATNDGKSINADSYYTFNVIVGKTVENDNYAKATHEFPFTVIFTNAAITNTVDIKSTVTGTATGFTDPAAAAMNNGGDTSNIKGVVKVKDAATVKYIGIPNGTSVEVYETNDVTGVVYKVDTKFTKESDVTTNITTDNTVTWGTAPASAVAQATTKEKYQSTKVTFTTTANADDDNAYRVAITNTLLTISPTGITLRVAPYILMLVVGILLIILMKSRRKTAREEE